MKTKLYKQLLVAALSLLIAVPALADMSNMAVIRLNHTPAEASAQFQIKETSSQGEQYFDTVAYFKVIPGQVLNIMLYAYSIDNWEFQKWTDANGNVISTQNLVTVQVSAAGEYDYTAHYRFHPRNPGYLPMGSYDLETGTLTIYNPQGSDDLMQNFYALADRYNLQMGGKYHQDMPVQDGGQYNPLNELIFQGFIDYVWQIQEFAHFTDASVYDFSQLAFPNNIIPSYILSSNTSVTTLKLGADVQAIEPYAFEGLIGLRDVYCYAENVPAIDSTSFTFTGGYYDEEMHEWVDVTEPQAIVNLYVPAQAFAAYSNDSVWPLLFNIQPMAVSNTANVTVYPEILEEGMYLTLSQVGDSSSVRVPLYANQTRYELPNLQMGNSYVLMLNSSLGFTMDIAAFLLNADTAIYLTNAAPLGVIPARVFVDTAEITDQCLISWLNTAGNNVFGTGPVSPLLPMQYETKINVNPMGELATYVLPKDTFAINELGHNGVWINLEKKPVGGQDTVRVETGTVVVTIAGDVSNTVGLLYDVDGNLLGKTTIEQLNLGAVFALPGLPVGCYSVVLMREGQYSTLSRLDLYQQMGLTQGTDYILESFCIEANQITQVSIAGIPEEPQITNFLGPNSHFYTNKSEVMVAGQLILTAEVEFLEEYRSDISNLFYVIDLPENVQLIENSVMVGSSAVSYSFQDGQLRVGVGLANLANINATALRFCVAPVAEGDFYPSASVEFNYLNQPKAQPVSNTHFLAKAITIQAPNYVIEKGVTVTGFAPAYANVNIVTAENETIGQGAANALGQYKIRCSFNASGSRTLVMHAEASTDIISGILSDTCSTFYDADAAAPKEIQMTHYNKWYKRNMTIIWNLDSCTTNEKYYYYYLNADFTFRVQFVGSVDTVTFIAIGQDGSRTSIPAIHAGNNEWYATEYIHTYKVPVRVDLVYGNAGTLTSYETCKSVSAIADPSGYVYEAVSSNRLEGVTAAAYMKKTEEDVPVLWDATDYDQENPMLTDAAGGYAWDVPAALWQVRFTKAGFEPAQTKWLPVPPPQMEVNMPLVRLSAPTVQSVNAYVDNVVIEFDRYMLPEDLTTEKIKVSDGANVIAGTILLLDKEERFKGDTVFYARKVKFVPNAEFTASSLTIDFDGCRSYAGIPMNASQSAGVVAEVKYFGQADTVHLVVGETKQCTFYALPQVASAGKVMLIRSTGELFSLAVNSAVIANNGGALFSFTGRLSGTTEFNLSVEGTTLEKYVTVVVAPAPSVITSVETVESQENTIDAKAEKFLENSTIYIRHNGKTYTTTGVQVKK